MNFRKMNAADVPAPAGGGYSQVVEISGFERIAFVSGQIPTDQNNQVPAGFRAQCRLAWANVEAQLAAVGMTLDHIVKVTTFVADRKYGLENREVRREVLGDRCPASTVIAVDIFDSKWLVEIEAVAAA